MCFYILKLLHDFFIYDSLEYIFLNACNQKIIYQRFLNIFILEMTISTIIVATGKINNNVTINKAMGTHVNDVCFKSFKVRS
jgi:hypothetical protein